MLTQYLVQSSFPESLQQMAEGLVNCAIALHARVSSTFLPTAKKFHYVFNLRDLSNIFQGVLFARIDIIKVIAQFYLF